MTKGFRTERIAALLEERKGRFPALIPLFDGGQVGEGNQGTLLPTGQGIRPLEAKEEEEIAAENRAREAVLEELSKAPEIASAGNLSKLKEVYMMMVRDLARIGWWLQDSTGGWSRKSPDPGFDEKESE